MVKRVVAVLAAIVLPYLIFSVVISLNKSDLDRDALRKSVTEFDIERRKTVQKPPPPEQPKPPAQRPQESLPSLTPNQMDSSLGDLGFELGIPGMNQTDFAELGETDLLNAGDNAAMDKDSVDIPPRVVRRSPIVYPELARKQGISGYVTMNVLIDEEGNVEDVKVLDSEPPEIFDLKADSTIRMWKFSPASYDGKAVKVWATQRIVFKLE